MTPRHITQPASIDHSELAGRLEYSVLGDVKVTHLGQDVRIGGPQQKAMLAFLLLRNGELASIEELCHGIWGTRLPTSAIGTIRTYIYRLRQVLSGDGVARCPIDSLSGGYRIKVGPESVDLTVFEGKVGQFRAARATGDVPAAARLAHEALSLWRGSAFGGATGEFIDRERERLDDLRLTVVHERLSLDLHLGRHRELVPELLALTAHHPLREGLWELLMLALYRSGRQADSLAAYRKVRRLLRAELGIEPGAGLHQLHQKILEAAPQLSPTTVADRVTAAQGPQRTGKAEREPRRGAADEEATGGPPDRVETQRVTTSRGSRPTPAQLPVDVLPFVGRRREIGRISSALLHRDGPRFVGITGMPGIGKTALAVHIGHRLAERFPDGQIFLEFGRRDGDVTEPYPVLHELIGLVEPDAGRLPSDLPDLSARWRSMVSRKRLLIIVDGVESTRQIQSILPAAPGCAVCVTSSTHIRGVPHVSWHQLGPLDEPDAAELLAELIGHERFARSREACARLLRDCSCLPYAIRIAAERACSKPGWEIDVIGEQLRAGLHRGVENNADARLLSRPIMRALASTRRDAVEAFRTLSALGRNPVTSKEVATVLGITRAHASALMDSLADVHLVEVLPDGSYGYPELVGAVVGQMVSERRRGEDGEGTLRSVTRRSGRDARPLSPPEPP